MDDGRKPNFKPTLHTSRGGYLVDVIEMFPGGPFVLTNKLDPQFDRGKFETLDEAIAAGEEAMIERGYQPGQSVPR